MIQKSIFSTKANTNSFCAHVRGVYAERSTDVVPRSPQHSVSLDWEEMLSHKRVNMLVSGTFLQLFTDIRLAVGA